MEKIVIFDMDGVLVDTEPVYYKQLEDFLISRGYAFPRAVLDRIQHFMIVRKPIAAITGRTIRGSGSRTASWRILTYIKR